MISILKNNFFINTVTFICLAFATPAFVFAQESEMVSQTLSVSPTLFQMSANPEQVWSSEIRVVNVNAYDMVVYPQVVNFAPTGESGRGDLLPVFSNETLGQTLAEWVVIATTSVLIPRQQTVTIPFSITVPSGAAPGGHYAAILVGTKSEENGSKLSQVQTSQYVTSLLFVKVSGDVVENGTIREFTTNHMLVPSPEIGFDLRFENTGNVHLQPQGDITVFNMWGTKRGEIPINYQTHFGNVLPKSIRKFSFTWSGESSIYDIGRYKAVATLGYGEGSKQFSTSVTYFWIIPFKQIFVLLLLAAAIIGFFSFAIKLYIRRMLQLAGVTTGASSQNNRTTFDAKDKRTVILQSYQTVTAPVRASVLDILKNMHAIKAFPDAIRFLATTFYRYRVFIIGLIFAAGLVVLTVVFLRNVHDTEAPFDVVINNPDADVAISSEEIAYRDLPPQSIPDSFTAVTNQTIVIEVINASGKTGLAAETRRKLEAHGYSITSLSNELNRSEKRTVIIFNPKNQDEALELSKRLSGALVSADVNTPEGTVRVFVGSDN